ncbi:MAG: hypothetical protein ACRCZO_12065 [Cetobacterium sp.]
MIRIDEAKIKEFSSIKKMHEEWYMKNIFENLKEAIEKLDGYSKKSSELRDYIKILKRIKKKKEKFVTDKKISNYLFNKLIRKFIYKPHKGNSKLEEELIALNVVDYKKYTPLKIFDYNKLTRGSDNWGRHKLLNKLGIEVCPYCQRNYITNYETNTGCEKTTGDLDHFYPKSEFPFLGLSLYNFIPSCQICNSRFKLNKDVYNSELVIIYPYKESFEKYNVKFKLSSEETIKKILNQNIDFYVEFNIPDSLEEKRMARVNSSISMFGLDLVYKVSHNKYIKDMLKNIEEYPDVYLEDISKMLSKDSDIDICKEKLEKILLQPYKFKYENGEPLGKMTKDILEQFKKI